MFRPEGEPAWCKRSRFCSRECPESRSYPSEAFLPFLGPSHLHIANVHTRRVNDKFRRCAALQSTRQRQSREPMRRDRDSFRLLIEEGLLPSDSSLPTATCTRALCKSTVDRAQCDSKSTQ